MQTKHLCVLIHIWTKAEVGAPLNRFKPSSKILLLTVPRQCFFCGQLMLFLSCDCYAFMHVCLLMSCGHLLGNGWPLGSRLWCLIVTFSLSHCYPGSGMAWLYRSWLWWFFSAVYWDNISLWEDWLWHLCVAADCMLGSRPGLGMRLCFPLSLHASWLDFRLNEGSGLKTYLLMRWKGLMLWLL